MAKFTTFADAKRWVESLGGQIRGPSPYTAGNDKVEGVIGPMRAHCGISAGTTGTQRQKDYEDAVIWIANELFDKGAERMVAGGS